MPVRHSFRSRQTGAGLIEVLIAVLVVTLGLLGAAGMHVRSVEFTMDTERRQMASMVATELLETMRSDIINVVNSDGSLQDKLGGYAKATGTALKTVTGTDCYPLSADPQTRLGCWGLRAKKLMPEVTDDTLTEHFSVTGDATSGVVTVTVAWPVKKGQCLKENGVEDEFCTFRLQSKI